jgi:hypothetical protein
MSFFKLLISCFLLTFSITSWPVFASGTYAKEIVIGSIAKMRGSVLRVSKGKTKSHVIKLKDKIYAGDKIITKSSSFIKILLIDDTLFQLGPNTNFSFEKFDFKTKNDRTAIYDLAKGQMRAIFTKKAKKDALKIKTPAASMGVRGTELLTDVYRHRGKMKTDVALLSGRVEMIIPKNKNRPSQRLVMKPGELFQSQRNQKNIQQGQKGRRRSQVSKMSKNLVKKLRRPSQNADGIFLAKARNTKINSDGTRSRLSPQKGQREFKRENKIRPEGSLNNLRDNSKRPGPSDNQKRSGQAPEKRDSKITSNDRKRPSQNKRSIRSKANKIKANTRRSKPKVKRPRRIPRTIPIPTPTPRPRVDGSNQ